MYAQLEILATRLFKLIRFLNKSTILTNLRQLLCSNHLKNLPNTVVEHQIRLPFHPFIP